MAEIAKPKGRPLEMMVLSDPYYVKYVIRRQSDTVGELKLKKEFKRLIAQFDEMKMNAECPNCGRPAKFLAYYKSTFFHELWCGECSPFWLEHFSGRMDIFNTYMSALDYVDSFCYGDRSLLKAIIRNLARLKGLSPKLNAREAKEFFRGAEEIVQRATCDVRR
ncbi:MAG TPA: hypothetical protein VHO43_17155 [Ignavibacteriales bacterium]|nr:hypothetical protein [Ignavibacteriales bacterium]